MATLDDLPTLPAAPSLSLDDLIGVIDLSDRRSPKKATIGDIVDLVSTDGIADRLDSLEAGYVDVASNVAKLALTPEPKQLVRITGEGNRIEQYIGPDASVNAGWVVLRNTVNLTVVNEYEGDVEINGVLCAGEDTTAVGWVDPLAVIGFDESVLNLISQTENGAIYAPSSATIPTTTFPLPYAVGLRAAVTITLG